MTMTNDFQPLLTCRAQHQQWANALHDSEADIDALLTLLAELPAPTTYRSLTNPTDYTAALNRLKNRLTQLRQNVVCTGLACTQPTPPNPCPDPHFAITNNGENLIASTLTDCLSIKGRCDAFLGELVGLNLI